MSRTFAVQDNTGAVERIPNRGVLEAWGTGAPTAGAVGYAPGCIYHRVDGAAGTALYVNEGTYSSATWVLVLTPSSTPTLASATITALTYGSLNDGTTTLGATALELNRAAKLSTRVVAAGAATLTVTLALHADRTILLDQATGVAVTLPAMTGTGAKYRFVCSVATSGGSHVVTATGAHLFGGIVFNTDTAASTLFTAVAAANPSGSTTITLNGSTQGGRKGDWFEIEDVATGVGIVRGMLNGSGTEATPFA